MIIYSEKRINFSKKGEISRLAFKSGSVGSRVAFKSLDSNSIEYLARIMNPNQEFPVYKLKLRLKFTLMEAAERKESSQELLINKIRLMKKFTCNIFEHELK